MDGKYLLMDTPVVPGVVKVYNARGLKAEVPCTRHLVYQNGGLNPGLIVWPDGEMLLHCRTEPHHAGKQGSFSTRRSTDGGISWTEPKVVASKPGVDCRNQEMCIAPNGDLVCVYCEREVFEIQRITSFPDAPVKLPYVEWGPQRWEMFAITSKDRGETWSEKTLIPDPPGWHLISPYAGANIGVLKNGKMVAPAFCVKEGTTYIHQPVEEWAAFMIESTDGKHWTTPNPVILGWSDEVDITELPNGDGLIALNRMGGVNFHAIYRQFSFDYGKSWHKPEMVAFDGMHPATSIWIGNDLLMTVGSRRYPFGARGVLSYDQGVKFDWVHQIVFSDNCGVGQERRDNGYPSSVLLPDGYLYTVWYKSHAEYPYFPGTEETYTAEATRVKWADVMSAIRKE
jgi:hypothetical protein